MNELTSNHSQTYMNAKFHSGNLINIQDTSWTILVFEANIFFLGRTDMICENTLVFFRNAESWSSAICPTCLMTRPLKTYLFLFKTY